MNYWSGNLKINYFGHQYLLCISILISRYVNVLFCFLIEEKTLLRYNGLKLDIYSPDVDDITFAVHVFT